MLMYGTGKIFCLMLQNSGVREPYCDSGVWGSLPPCSSEVHTLVSGQSSFGVHRFHPHLAEAPHMHAGYPRKGSKALCSSESEHVQGRGTFSPFT